ncbi:hypothetical protein F5Y15DRAFT_410694 [Xylariaceae sp. FL0016]|nr:hypothetical protein F5Y15DRAFT_410694 [Xylariaceae sp. FL0016]
MSSLEEVLGTTELLEAILLQLDLPTLLVSALRVSHYFNDVISQSIAIQQALFFAPSPRVSTQGPPILNPLLLKPFTLWFHPSGHNALKNRGYSVHSFKDMEIWKQTPKAEPFMRRGASWRRMLVQQPPLTYLPMLSRGFAFFPLDGRIRAVALRGAVDCEPGLRMGMLYDLTHRRLGVASEYASYYFRLVRAGAPPEGEEMREEMAPLLDQFGVVYEEHGYYPQRVLGRDIEDQPWDNMYRHPEFENVDVDMEELPS